MNEMIAELDNRPLIAMMWIAFNIYKNDYCKPQTLKDYLIGITLLQMKLCAKWAQNSDVSIKNPLSPKPG